MKIIHICLASFYIDNYAYQENMIPKYHKQFGHDVSILASLISFGENGQPCLLNERADYINEYGIPVKRVPYKKNLSILAKRLRIYNHDTYGYLRKEKPDIIFIHGCQFWDIHQIVKYAKLNRKVKIFIDNHGDLLNSATNWFSKNVLHKIIWKHCAHLIEPFSEKFYGVLPARVDFLNQIYKIPKEKIELLVMGADDEKVVEARNKKIRNSIREKFDINENDFLIITGGKLDKNKTQTLLLMEAIKSINLDNVKLIILGSVVPEYQDKFNSLLCNSVQYIGWVDANEVYKYFNAGELAVFPGFHSVFWEQIVGLGKPCVFKYIEGFTHIDLGGNCKFLFEDSVEEIRKVITEIVNNNELYENMKNVAMTKGMDAFSYKKIAQKSIEY